MVERVGIIVAALGGLVCACTAEFGVEPRDGNQSRGLGSDVPDDANGDEVDLPTPAANLEECGNDIDDDGDGAIDEDCGCEPNTDRLCYIGDPAVRNVGACTEGVQLCDDSREFPEWGTCQDAVLPSAEIIGNGIDDDCDGLADCEDTEFEADPICLGPCGAQTETYHDRLLGAGFGGKEGLVDLAEGGGALGGLACDPAHGRDQGGNDDGNNDGENHGAAAGVAIGTTHENSMGQRAQRRPRGAGGRSCRVPISPCRT